VPFIQIIILAAIQGITEFLPISSSGHLLLAPKLTGWADQGLMMDVAVHVGTLFAVILYFWRDMIAFILALFRSVNQVATRRRLDPEFGVMVKLIFATLPVIGAGFLVDMYYQDLLRNVEIMAWATIGFAILLYWADKSSMTIRRMEHITFFGALVIGLFQVLALIPGTSRAGITMTAARLLGVERQDAARFSLLLSIPVILGAGTLKGKELYETGNEIMINDALTIAGLSFLFALVTLSLLMVWLRRASFTPFVIYRLLLGAALLYIIYWAPDFTLI
jgi:undecaprenyl-diphosphatase